MQNYFNISGMGCQVCADKITASVGALKGVGKVEVDLSAKRMSCDFDPKAVTPEQIIAAVQAAGYEAELE